MLSKFPEPIFQEKIASLTFSAAFKLAAQQGGYEKLIDLARTPVPVLSAHSGFTNQLIMEYSRFMEDHQLGHYIDDPY
ncbi:hypothetical protein ACXZ1K_01000 [Pedobacter sp. PWIIR3]